MLKFKLDIQQLQQRMVLVVAVWMIVVVVGPCLRHVILALMLERMNQFSSNQKKKSRENPQKWKQKAKTKFQFQTNILIM